MGAKRTAGRRWRRILATTAAQAGPALEGALRAVVDFAVIDACCACGVRTGCPPERSGLPRAARSLAAPTAVPFLGLFTLVNHPFCRDCLAQFEECDGPAEMGVYGASQGRGWARTRSGELFVHPAWAPTGCFPTPAPPAPVGLDVYAPFRTNDASLNLVRLIKFGLRTSLVPLASAAMARALAPLVRELECPVLVPVPMHPSARRRRGFNQAVELAKGAGAVLGAPVVSALRKTGRTPPQSKTAHGKRADNVRSTFRPSGAHLAGRHVCLVDDLVTTGATAAACAAVALAGGACRVTVLCLARTP